MKLWAWLLGTVQLQITCGDPAMFLSRLSEAGIEILGTGFENEITVRVLLPRTDRKRVEEISRKLGGETKLLRCRGLYWSVVGFMRHPVLVAGLAFLLALSLYLPTRVLFVEVEGNTKLPTLLILEQAELCGIRFGASRGEVRSEKMKNALLSAMPQLQWAGVNTYGCRAVITVRERENAQQLPAHRGISSLIAVRDGVISSVTVTKGSALCAVGQAVKRGQILISGYTDCGLVIQGTAAQGEVFADTHRSLTAVVPEVWQKKGEQTEVRKKYSLRIGKKLINFEKGSGICPSVCDRIYEEKYVVLPGGFQLPLALIVETVWQSDCEQTALQPEDFQPLMEEIAKDYLKQQMVAGEIRTCAFLCENNGALLRLSGEFACREMIGRVQKEEIVTPNGNSN